MSGDGTEQDRRWSVRHSIHLDVVATDSAGRSHTAKITNLSEEGCLIHTLSGSDLVRDRLHTVKVIGHEVVTAYVIWSAKGISGLVFSTPLDPSTVQGLVMKSDYARMSRRAVRNASADDSLPPLPPFPFDD